MNRVEIDIMHTKVPPPPNLNGEKGPKCNNCGGWGSTIWLSDGKARYCEQCDYTGVESKKELFTD